MSQKVFPRVLGRAREAVAEGERVALCQIVRTEGSTPGKAGWKLAVPASGAPVGNLGGGAFEALVLTDARRMLGAEAAEPELKRYYFTEDAVRGEPTGMVCGGMAEVFLEVMHASPVLLVCGGGPVGQALAVAGDLAGFEVVVVEDRDEFLRPELFPAGTELLRVDREFSGGFLADLARRDLYAAVVTRCWETDVAALEGILGQPLERLHYLGLLGSRRKVERVREELATRGHDLGEVPFHGPVGLPIGGDSPGEIAISILAEVLEQRHASSREKRSRGPRRVTERPGPA
ncbi:MAG: XdhC/CoxI family protein [Thermoanaerobaculia bacterium]|nr:XdhC/CoxI family protein [Thermoanaerobaculia bacterium]